MQTVVYTLDVHQRRRGGTRVERRERRRAAKRKRLMTIVAVLTYIAMGATGGATIFMATHSTGLADAAFGDNQATIVENFTPEMLENLPDISTYSNTFTEEEVAALEEAIDITRSAITVTDYDHSGVDYSAQIRRVYDLAEKLPDGDREYMLLLCEILEAQRNLKIRDQALDYVETNTFTAEHSADDIEAIMNPTPPFTPYYTVTDAEIIRLAKVCNGEAGADWCTNEERMDVITTILNRRDDPRFPNSIDGVIDATNPVQYATRNHQSYTDRDLYCVMQVVNYGPSIDTSVVWQAQFAQGRSVVRTYNHGVYADATYFCR